MADLPAFWISEDGSAVQIGSTVMPRAQAVALARRLLAALLPLRRISDTAKAEIVKRYAAGEGTALLAREYDCSGATVLNEVRKAGISTHNPEAGSAARVVMATRRRNGGAAP